jgi:hypothetical protein
MRKIFSGRRRYALACLVIVGGLITVAASCEPTKAPNGDKPAPSGLSISPTEHDFGTDLDPTGPQEFTVTNNGPNTTDPLNTAALSGINVDNFNIDSDECVGDELADGASCTVTADFTPSGADGPRQATLTVDSTNPDDGEAVATLTGEVTD